MIDDMLDRLLRDGRADLPATFEALRRLRVGLTHEGDQAACDIVHAIYLHLDGRYDEALALLTHALFAAEAHGRTPWAVRGWCSVAQLYGTFGLSVDADEALAHGEGLAGADPRLQGFVRRARAATARRSGRPADSAALYDVILAEPEPPGMPDPAQHQRDRVNAASAYQQVGRLDDAARALAQVTGDLTDDLAPWVAIIGAWTSLGLGEAVAARALLLPWLDKPLPFDATSSALRCLAAAALAPPADVALQQVAGNHLERLLDRGGATLPPDQRAWLNFTLADLADAAGDTITSGRRRAAGETHRKAAELQNENAKRGHNALRIAGAHRLVQLGAARQAVADLEAERAATLRRLGEQGRRLAALRHDVANELTFVHSWLPLGEEPSGSTDVAGLRRAVERLGEMILAGLDAEGRAASDPAAGAVDLARVAHQLTTEAAALAKQRGLNLVVSGDAPVVAMADRPSVVRIVENLLSNAVRYAVPGVVEVRTASVGGQAQLTVTDQGPGLPPDLVVGAYRSVATGRTRGSGLGLYAVRSLVDALGGTFHARAEGSGTAFVVSLPLADLDTRSGVR